MKRRVFDSINLLLPAVLIAYPVLLLTGMWYCYAKTGLLGPTLCTIALTITPLFILIASKIQNRIRFSADQSPRHPRYEEMMQRLKKTPRAEAPN